MSLENLLRIGRIRAHATDRTEIGKLLKAAARNLKDAGNTDNSNAVRFNCAYTAIMQLSQAALFANGYRPNTSEGGHHVTMVQALVHTIGLDPARMQVLDAHRRKRNVIDYSGDDAETSEVRNVIAAAQALLKDTKVWLEKNHPELV